MLNTQLVQDQFNQHYKIQTRIDRTAPFALSAERFNTSQHASRFVNNLRVPAYFWRQIYQTVLTKKTVHNQTQLLNEIATLFHTGKLKAYKVTVPSNTQSGPEKRTITGSDKNKHIFTSTSTLLVSTPKKVVQFTSKAEAKKYLVDLSPDKESLVNINKEFNLATDNTNASLEELIDQTANGLASGEVIIVVDEYSAPPPTSTESIVEMLSDKKAGSGPEAAAVIAPVIDKEHLCVLNKMTLSCKHGRSAVLDPATPIDPETGAAKIAYLAVTSVSENSPKKDQELITAKIDINDKCDSHIKSPYTITSDTAKLVNNNFGETIKFYSPGKELNLATEFYKYIWLPSIKPISYKVIPPDFCDMTQFAGKAKSVRLDVYPDIKWDIGLDIGFGQIKASDSSPGDKQKASNNVIQRKIEDEVFSVQGKAVCTHGTAAPIEFVSKFSNKFDALKQEISGQNALLSKIFGKFEEGDNHSVTLDLPKLSFNGTSSIAEKSGTPDVDVKWDYNIKAAPLIGIKAEVDVLPMLLKSSGWGSLFLPLLSELKEDYANPDGSVGIQLEASIILSISGKVEFDLNFTDSTFVHDEKEQLRSLKFDVPFFCKGELKGKGHLLVFAVELGVLAKLDSGFAYEMYMGADAEGIYRSSILHFHGLVFEIKAYIQGERKAPGKKKSASSGLLANIKSNSKTTVKRRKEYDNKWTWIDKRKIEFSKEHIIKNT